MRKRLKAGFRISDRATTVPVRRLRGDRPFVIDHEKSARLALFI